MVAAVKKLILRLLHFLGFFAVVRFLNRDKITIMMLHSVMSKNQSCTWEPMRDQLSPAVFEKSLEFISKRYTFLSLSQAIDILEGKAPKVKNGLVLTFDDGYRNNITYALPILKKFGVKPTFFVTTNHLSSQKPFWFDHLDFALQHVNEPKIEVVFDGEKVVFDASNRQALSESYRKFRYKCKDKFKDDLVMLSEFDKLAAQLESKAQVKLRDIMDTDDWAGIMKWSELAEVVNAGDVEVGSHTLDHYRLDCLAKEEVRRQLEESKKVIEEKLGIECQFFCYPNGNHNKVAEKLVKEVGYRAAVTTKNGLCSVGDDLTTLKRINFANTTSLPTFNYLLSGLSR